MSRNLILWFDMLRIYFFGLSYRGFERYFVISFVLSRILRFQMITYCFEILVVDLFLLWFDMLKMAHGPLKAFVVSIGALMTPDSIELISPVSDRYKNPWHETRLIRHKTAHRSPNRHPPTYTNTPN